MPKYLKIPTFYNFPTLTVGSFKIGGDWNVSMSNILKYFPNSDTIIDGSDTVIVGLFNVILIACKESAALLVKLSNRDQKKKF